MSADLYDSAIVVSILAATLRTMTPLLFSAMGELVTQRAGIWNMSVEGAMLSGAFAAYIVIATTGSPVLALLAAILAGMMVSLLNAILTASLKVDHFVAGLALNLLAAGLTLFWFRAFISGRGQPTFDGLAPPDWALADLPVLGPILFAQRPLTWLAFLCVPLVWFLLYRTRQGLELRCLGENPAVLDFKGVNVVARQYAASLFGGAMTGLGGGFLILAFSDRFLPDITAGRGWLVRRGDHRRRLATPGRARRGHRFRVSRSAGDPCAGARPWSAAPAVPRCSLYRIAVAADPPAPSRQATGAPGRGFTVEASDDAASEPAAGPAVFPRAARSGGLCRFFAARRAGLAAIGGDVVRGFAGLF